MFPTWFIPLKYFSNIYIIYLKPATQSLHLIRLDMSTVVIIKCFVSQIKLSAYIIKHNVSEMGKSDAFVTVHCTLRPRLGQRACILLVWKRAERPGKYPKAKLSGIR